MTEDNIHKRILKLTLPAIISNISVPLLGVVDSTIVGHMGSSVFIGTVALGTTIFNMMYWLMGFLRMGTTGLVAQAHGQEDQERMKTVLRKALQAGCIISAAMVILQWPLFEIATRIMHPDADTLPQLHIYFSICIWGAPAVLGQYCFNGWFIGAQDTRSPMFVALFQNLVNILLSLFLVYGMGWKMEGVATGTLVATMVGTGSVPDIHASSSCQPPHYRRPREHPCALAGVSGRQPRPVSAHTLSGVRDRIFRACRQHAGQRHSGCQRAADAALHPLLLHHRRSGQCRRGTERQIHRRSRPSGTHPVHPGSLLVGRQDSAVFTLAYIFGGEWIICFFTDIPRVQYLASLFLPWVYLIPIVALQAMVWDGVFIGMTYTRGMLFATVGGAAVFFATYLYTKEFLGNDALWMAFLSYLFTRGIIQTLLATHKLRFS